VQRVRREAEKVRLQLAGEAREGEVEAAPGVRAGVPHQIARRRVQPVGEEEMRRGAAEAIRFGDDRHRHVRAQPRHGERGERAGDAAARYQDARSLAPRHNRPPLLRPAPPAP